MECKFFYNFLIKGVSYASSSVKFHGLNFPEKCTDIILTPVALRLIP